MIDTSCDNTNEFDKDGAVSCKTEDPCSSEASVADSSMEFGKEFKLNPYIKRVWYIHAAIFIVSMVVVWEITTFYLPDVILGLPIYITDYVLYGLLAVWFIFFNVIGGFLQYNFSSYTVEKDAIVIKTGAFIRKTTLIPYVRIQHTGHEEGVIMNHYGLVQLSIATASSLFVLDGLEKERADELTAMIAYAVERAREDV